MNRCRQRCDQSQECVPLRKRSRHKPKNLQNIEQDNQQVRQGQQNQAGQEEQQNRTDQYNQW